MYSVFILLKKEATAEHGLTSAS